MIVIEYPEKEKVNFSDLPIGVQELLKEFHQERDNKHLDFATCDFLIQKYKQSKEMVLSNHYYCDSEPGIHNSRTFYEKGINFMFEKKYESSQFIYLVKKVSPLEKSFAIARYYDIYDTEGEDGFLIVEF